MANRAPALTQYLIKREKLKHYRDLLLYRIGVFATYRAPILPKNRRMICVCYGNICRSPFAEVVLRQRGYQAVSVGLHTAGGRPANEKAIAAADPFDVDLRGHVSSTIYDLTLTDDDYLLFMEYDHIRAFKRADLGVGVKPTLVLLGIHGDRALPRIYDPYGKSPAAFAACFDAITRSLTSLCQPLPQTLELPDCG